MGNEKVVMYEHSHVETKFKATTTIFMQNHYIVNVLP